MALQLEGGLLDAVKTPHIDDFARLRTNPQYVGQIAPNSGTFFEIGINTKTKPMDDKRVRQALNYALDRKRYAETIFKGAAIPIDLPWSESSPAFDASKNNVYPYDLNKARALLQEAGVSSFETDILVIGIAQPQLLAFTEIYQASLAEIGIKLNVKNLEQAVWLDLVINKKPDYTGFWGSSDTFANVSPGSLFALSPGWRLNNNHSNFTDDAYTELVGRVSTETDPAKQKQAFADMNDVHPGSVVHDAHQHQSDHAADHAQSEGHPVPDAHRCAQLHQHVARRLSAGGLLRRSRLPDRLTEIRHVDECQRGIDAARAHEQQ